MVTQLTALSFSGCSDKHHRALRSGFHSFSSDSLVVCALFMRIWVSSWIAHARTRASRTRAHRFTQARARSVWVSRVCRTLVARTLSHAVAHQMDSLSFISRFARDKHGHNKQTGQTRTTTWTSMDRAQLGSRSSHRALCARSLERSRSFRFARSHVFFSRFLISEDSRGRSRALARSTFGFFLSRNSGSFSSLFSLSRRHLGARTSRTLKIVAHRTLVCLVANGRSISRFKISFALFARARVRLRTRARCFRVVYRCLSAHAARNARTRAERSLALAHS